MLKQYAFSFYDVISRIEELRSEARVLGRSHPYGVSTKLYAYRFDQLIAVLIELRTECNALDLVSTIDLISHIESEAQQRGKDYSYSDLLNHLDTLSVLFAKELEKKKCFRIATEKEKYFPKDDLFGGTVNTAFPSCAPEIRNAANCYALEQNEATAYHSIRILERGLDILAQKFKVDFMFTNWHNVVEQVEKQITKIDSSFGPDWKEQQKFFSQAATHLMFLKDAWRNHIMHGREP